jgi:hypothetical protein
MLLGAGTGLAVNVAFAGLYFSQKVIPRLVTQFVWNQLSEDYVTIFLIILPDLRVCP